MILEKFLPVRSPADIIGGVIRVAFGADEYLLPVLTIDENERWLIIAKSALAALFEGFTDLDDPDAIFARFVAGTTTQLDVITAYDLTEVLPEKADIRKTASQDQLLRATLEVLAAAFPTVAIVLDLAVRNPLALRTFVDQMIATMAISSPATNGSLPPTAGGRRGTSGAGSRTSRSSNTSTGPRNGSAKRQSRSGSGRSMHSGPAT